MISTARARRVIRHTARSLRGRDLSLWTAGLTFFACLAAIPVLLLALRGAAWLTSDQFTSDGVAGLVDALPDEHDGREGLRALVDAALGSSWWLMVVALLPATFYGEGLRRAMRQVEGASPGRLAGWKGRAGFLPLLALSPVLVVLLLTTAPAVVPLYKGGGLDPVWGVIATFHVDWLVVSVCLSVVYVVHSPAALPVRTAVACGFATAAVVTGFLHGFLLFLSIPIDWAVPFGGIQTAGEGVALALWMYLLHALVLMGYRVALSVHATE
ncbi:YhjD/YihY/BrkB family envelope integrity protein [Actinokineospora sp. G85]|uniref:YhjD/YihY/BrkB family envelope integrity protein n=1 Tax=Actinokineospora sp. G85 TaxID=3406626 RepID=UPI003C72938C